MNNSAVYAAFIITAAISTGLACTPAPGSPAGLPVALCEALQVVQPGDRIPVRLAGIYLVGYEHQFFYDPKQPTCEANIQPSTWVEFAPGAPRSEDLERLIKQSGRAFVTFSGELYGPGAVRPDDPSLAANVALANRVAARRYGHLNAFRTKLVVHEVVSTAAVPDSQPWDAIWAEPPGHGGLGVLSAAVPQYPSLARRAGIGGRVVAEVVVEDGQVACADVKSGDRMLATEAVANIHTWQFDPGTNVSFTTTFVYQLERRKAGDQQARVELRLPELVTITAASYDW